MHRETKDNDSYETTHEDCALPEGWKKVAHCSGRVCFQLEPSGVIVWSQPYTLQPDPTTDLRDSVQTHHPQLEIFAAGCGYCMDTTKSQRAAEIALQAFFNVWRCIVAWGGIGRRHRQCQTHIDSRRSQEPYYALNKGRENEDGQYQVLSIDDRHVFPCCLRYSIKTPAQLLTEFQAKNKGVAVIYTNSIVVGALTNIRVIESVGPTSAEGFADKKKLAKQYAAQSLLVKLNPEVTTISSASMKTASSDR
ncbi:hypothetical protein LEN26_019326 [Aphanomyces euteiches]|nr:hypothetical protein LEN26_019326 [Aphanomyces euteiches]